MAKNHRKDCEGFYPGDDVCYFLDPDARFLELEYCLEVGQPSLKKSPASCNFRNKLIRDWSIARTHHKCFVEVWKRRELRSGRATTRAPNH